ncbi:biotin synthase BioB [Candidatus Sumerlaeota bacterium]|nr:biotin synthase BioB [Candidatus Sumerlaeota bacterium]
MTVCFQEYAAKVTQGKALSREECREILHAPNERLLALLDAAYQVRRHFCGGKVHIQVLSNAKSGKCQEDCHYCSQSKVSTADVKQYPLLDQETLLEEAGRAKRLRAKRYCMAMSGRGPSDREIDKLCDVLRAIKQKHDISLCCSLGLMTLEQARRLKEAGLNRVNHNLNTSQSHHPQICTTHTYQDRLQTLRNCREAGLELCSGGIIGQGESDEDIIDFALALAELRPESIPINFLIPIEGTPFAGMDTGLTPQRCLKVLCLMRLMIPDRELRMAGGREYHLRSLQPLALYPCNSLFVTGYLTTPGQRGDEALRMIRDMGFEMEFEEQPDEALQAALESDQNGLPVTHSAKIAGAE